MKKNIEEMKTENGYFEINGKEYILTEQASFTCDVLDYLDDTQYYDKYYSARAICPADAKDEDGYQKCYLVRWKILDSYDSETDGEDLACDWEAPSDVTEQGMEYSLELNCYY